eukprot:GHVS01001139.1.p1 GENE.GHVS01001139.1~~GHVS01001139.1.p1  ORF type:complete len:375 (-),score=6.69 GHVS01001139.1:803-1846(-)
MSAYPFMPKVVEVHMGDAKGAECGFETLLFETLGPVGVRRPSELLEMLVGLIKKHTNEVTTGNAWQSSLMLSDKALMLRSNVDETLNVFAVRWDEYTFRVPKGTTNWTYKAIPVDYYHPRYFVIPCTLPIQDEMSAVYLGKGDGSFRGETKFSTRVVMHWAGHLYAAVFPPTVGISTFEKKEVKNIPNVQLLGERFAVTYVRDNEMWLSFGEVTYRALLKFEASNGDAVYLEFKDKMIDPHPETKTDISVFVDAWPTARPLFVITQDELKQPPKEFVQTLTNKVRSPVSCSLFNIMQKVSVSCARFVSTCRSVRPRYALSHRSDLLYVLCCALLWSKAMAMFKALNA